MSISDIIIMSSSLSLSNKIDIKTGVHGNRSPGRQFGGEQHFTECSLQGQVTDVTNILLDRAVEHNNLVIGHLVEPGQVAGVHYLGPVVDLHHHVCSGQPGPEEGGEKGAGEVC